GGRRGPCYCRARLRPPGPLAPGAARPFPPTPRSAERRADGLTGPGASIPPGNIWQQLGIRLTARSHVTKLDRLLIGRPQRNGMVMSTHIPKDAERVPSW